MKKLFFVTLIFVSALVLYVSAIGQQDDIKKRLADCAAIKADIQRLECYDKIAKDLGLIGTTSTIPVAETGKWKTKTEVNPIDDTKTVVLSLIADEGKSRMGNEIVLVLRCLSNDIKLYIAWWDYLGDKRTNVLTRIGNAQAETLLWVLSTDSQATFYPGNAINFIKSLISADKLVAQVTPYSESPITAVFDIRGLAEAIKPLQETCSLK